MADIFVLPLKFSPDGVRRLHLALEAASRSGIDLGPRQAQISCLSDALLRSVRELEDVLPCAAAHLLGDDPTALRLLEAVARVRRAAQIVLRFADASPRALPEA